MQLFSVAFFMLSVKIRGNRPRSIYQYSNMAPRLSGQTSIFGVVFFVSKSLLGIERQKKLAKICNFDPKASEPCLNIDISNVAYCEKYILINMQIYAPNSFAGQKHRGRWS